MAPFHQILANNLIANLTNFTVWFALTFWVFLETRSVFATGMISGVYLALIAASGLWFGGIVDRYDKKRVMLASSTVSFGFYAIALTYLTFTPEAAFRRVEGVALWLLIGLVMLGVIAGNLRGIVLPTLVTALVPEDRRDKANGLVGMVSGIGFLTTSMVSGFLVAWGGMKGTLAFALVLTMVAFCHLLFVPLKLGTAEGGRNEGQPSDRKLDLPGTIRVIAAVPGLFALIIFATFNNFLGGVFMALMDAYGLSMMKVQQWGLLWAGVSCAFIISGVLISRTGLGRNPLRTLMMVNLAAWSVAAVFTLKSSIPLLAAGCFLWMLFGPYAEAAEQTTLQKVVPFERQGRVFGFAQSVEQAASPLTAFLIGPITQFFVIPFMTNGAGADAIGDWFGRGAERGIALVFTVAGLAGIVVTVLAFRSRYYRQLSDAYARGKTPVEEAPA